MESPADRTWELLRWDGEWLEVIGMDDMVIVLASGEGMVWRRGQHGMTPRPAVPDERLRLRYTVPVRDPEGSLVPMAWRPASGAKLPILAQDMGKPELGQEIRRAQSE